MQYDVNQGLLQVIIEGEEINAVVGEAAQINVGEAINYIRTGTEEIEQAVQEGITEFNGNAVEKTNEFDLNAQNKTSDFNSNATQKTLDFNSNASDKTSDFNLNAQEKTSEFNANAVEKTNDFNSNAQDKTGDFNENAVDKTGDFNDNASDKTDAFDLNAQNKTTDFNDNYTEKKGLIDAQVSIAEGAATTATTQAGLSKQWAVGDPSEPTGNSSKYWATQASSSAIAAATSEDHAEVWAEGTDQEVQALGGLHSAKGWAEEAATGQINSDWTETDTSSKAYILHKPTAGANISLANNQISAVSDASPTSSSTNLVQSGGVYTSLNNLQTQIDAIVASSDVFDIVGTYAELQAYDISTVPVNDIIKVLVDSTHSNAATYYRCVESGGVKSWSYVGSEGAYYTKGEADNKFSTITATGNSLDYTGNTLSLENSSGTVLSSVTIQSSPDLDNKSITKNSSQELQTVGVIDQNNTSNAIKTWTGTKAQYEAIASKDANTQYMITDTGEIYLGTTQFANLSSVRNIGEIIQSTIPLTDAGLHLLDGSLISGSGSYGAFVTYIASLVSSYPDLFETEANWQSSVTNYGVCGKFVYDSTNNTVRLPKITGFTEGTTDVTALGDLVEAGLPNITGVSSWISTGSHMTKNSKAFGKTSYNAGGYTNNGNSTAFPLEDFDASRSNSIYGNSTTVQPQSVKVLYYIVIANSVKTNIEVDIDEIMTDLNGKADVDLSNSSVPHIVETYVKGTSWYRVWSDGWCEQGGMHSAGQNVTVTLLKPYRDTNYIVLLTGIASTQAYTPLVRSGNTATNFHVFSAGNGSHSGFWQACGYIN